MTLRTGSVTDSYINENLPANSPKPPSSTPSIASIEKTGGSRAASPHCADRCGTGVAETDEACEVPAPGRTAKAACGTPEQARAGDVPVDSGRADELGRGLARRSAVTVGREYERPDRDGAPVPADVTEGATHSRCLMQLPDRINLSTVTPHLQRPTASGRRRPLTGLALGSRTPSLGMTS